MQGARRCCGPENVTRQRVCICGLSTSPAMLLIYSRGCYFGDLKRVVLITCKVLLAGCRDLTEDIPLERQTSRQVLRPPVSDHDNVTLRTRTQHVSQLL
jgi:hypothetical protein